jgi:alkaline phosphatase D
MLDRRELVLAAPAALSLARALPAWGRAAPGADPFTLGVASGDPADDGFVIWTRLAPDPLALDGLGGLRDAALVRWEVAEDEAMSRIAARGELEADPRSAHAVHVEVAGLRPDRPYWYRFTALGARSATGRARTAPRPDQPLERLRLTVASCAHYEVGYFSAYRHMAEEAADLTLFLGDYIYEYSYPDTRPGGKVRSHGQGEAVGLAGYRHRYARYKTDPDLQALHASAPCLATWDDHEVENDYADRWSQFVGTAPEAFLQRRAAAYQAFYEHMPIRRTRLEGAAMRIYNRFRFGRLAEISLLDTRQYRSMQACLPPTTRRARVVAADCAGRTDPGRSLLGQDQERWLFEGFRHAEARWNLVAQSLMAASVLQKGARGIVGHWSDGWDGYPASRDRLLAAFAASRLSNPVVLSGDIHAFWANDIAADPRDPGSPAVAAEFVTSSITADGPPPEPFIEMAPQNPHVRFFDTPHGYVSIDLTPERMRTRFRAISERRDPDASVSTLRAFTVENGRPGLTA